MSCSLEYTRVQEEMGCRRRETDVEWVPVLLCYKHVSVQRSHFTPAGSLPKLSVPAKGSSHSETVCAPWCLAAQEALVSLIRMWVFRAATPPSTPVLPPAPPSAPTSASAPSTPVLPPPQCSHQLQCCCALQSHGWKAEMSSDAGPLPALSP